MQIKPGASAAASLALRRPPAAAAQAKTVLVGASGTLAGEAKEGAVSAGPAMTHARSARDKLNAEVAPARSAASLGAVSSTGRSSDFQSLTDEELASVKLNADGVFTRDEGSAAQAELSARVRVTLAPFALNAAQDPRSYQTAIQFVYEGMPSSVREALGWDHSMITASKRLVESSEEKLGPTDKKSLLQQLLDHYNHSKATGDGHGLDLEISGWFLEATPVVLAPGSILDQRI